MDIEPFEPTQPLAEHQPRLTESADPATGPHSPNHIPLGMRLISAVVALTWTGWALIGLLSGHMFLLISRRGPIQFSGIPAWLFSAAVMASAVACAVVILDHYDRRKNEASYQRTRRRLWWTALLFFCLAAGVGCAERSGWLPYTDGRIGLLSTDQLRSLLASPSIHGLLSPYAEALDRWALILMLWFLFGGLALKKLGLLKDGVPLSPGVGAFLLVFLVSPALLSFTLALMSMLTSGYLPSGEAVSEDQIRARLAFFQSMLLTCLAAVAFLLITLGVLVLRRLGVVPPLPDPDDRVD